jgi:FlaG/FlaF family flagellin (archaellin)
MSCKAKKKRTRLSRRDDAVSAVVGEMLMLTVVVIIMALVSVNAQSVLPPGREPTVTVKMDSAKDLTGKLVSLDLYHKGGDAVDKEDLKVVISTKNDQFTFSANKFTLKSENSEIFDLGSEISVDDESLNLLSADSGGYTVKLATSRTVLFTGVIP